MRGNRSVHDTAAEPTVHLGTSIPAEVWSQWRLLCLKRGVKSRDLLKQVVTDYITNTQERESI